MGALRPDPARDGREPSRGHHGFASRPGPPRDVLQRLRRSLPSLRRRAARPRAARRHAGGGGRAPAPGRRAPPEAGARALRGRPHAHSRDGARGSGRSARAAVAAGHARARRGGAARRRARERREEVVRREAQGPSVREEAARGLPAHRRRDLGRGPRLRGAHPRAGGPRARDARRAVRRGARGRPPPRAREPVRRDGLLVAPAGPREKSACS